MIKITHLEFEILNLNIDINSRKNKSCYGKILKSKSLLPGGPGKPERIPEGAEQRAAHCGRQKRQVSKKEK